MVEKKIPNVKKNNAGINIHQDIEIKNRFCYFLMKWNFTFCSSYKIVPLQAPTLLLDIPLFQNDLIDPIFMSHPIFKK